MYIVFEEQKGKDKLLDNKFVGFKRLSFTDEFITQNVKNTWGIIRHLVNEDKLEKEIVTRKDGTPIMNRNGLVRKAVNFPKSKDHIVFVRGTGSDLNNKPLHLNGIDMYHQQIW